MFSLKIDFLYILKCTGDVVPSGASDRVAIKWSKREVTWQHVEHPIMQRIVTVDGHLRPGGRGYVVHPDSMANCFLNDLISTVDQRS